MRVRMVGSISGTLFITQADGTSIPTSPPQAGDIVELDDDLARAWISQKMAAEVVDPPVEQTAAIEGRDEKTAALTRKPVGR